MKKITFMMSLLLAMGSMTTSAQVLDRTGWKITTSGECDDSGSGHANAIIDGKNNTYWHSNWASKGQANSSGDASKKTSSVFPSRLRFRTDLPLYYVCSSRKPR